MLSYNVVTLWRNVIASISYRSEHIGAIIASYSYRSKPIDQCRIIASISYCYSLFGSAFQLCQFICVQKYRIDLKLFLPNKLLITCNMFSHNEIIEHIYFKYSIIGSKVISVQRYSIIYSVLAITLRYILHNRITLYHF